MPATQKKWDPRNLTERMELALLALSCSEDTLQTRLQAASIHLSALQTNEFPEAVQNEFEQIFVHLTRTEKTSAQGLLKDSISDMSSDEAHKLIERIVHFCADTWKCLGS
jgi:hypothetical protein